MGFYDLDKRLEAISAKGDPLEVINATVPFERFRPELEAVVRPAPEERKSNAGRKPYDAVPMFKILVLQTLYNLADEQLEYLIRDRLSFMRWLIGRHAGAVRDKHLQAYLDEFAFRHNRRKTNGVGRIAARVIEPLVAHEPIPMRKLIDETRRCRWFGSNQRALA